jgi:thioredoxin 1
MEINSSELQEKIDNNEKVIVEMYATWCGPCKVLKPIFEKVSNENTTDVQMYMMDVDSNRDFAVKYGVRSVPTIKVFNGSISVGTKVGLVSEGDIKELVSELIHE